jgi:prevent-host-death family protein
MQTLGAFEAKTHFSSLLEQVEQGEEFLITRHGHPVAKLISIKSNDRKQVHGAIQRLKIFSQTQTLQGLDWKSLRDEGRR